LSEKYLRIGDAALKINSECSFTARKLRFLADFCLASPSLGDFSDKPGNQIAKWPRIMRRVPFTLLLGETSGTSKLFFDTSDG